MAAEKQGNALDLANKIADGDAHISKNNMRTYKADGVEITWEVEYEPVSRDPASDLERVASIIDAVIVDEKTFVGCFGAAKLDEFKADPIGWAQLEFGGDLSRLAKGGD
jgi:hypothetical protein